MNKERSSQYSMTRRHNWGVIIGINVIILGLLLGIGEVIARNLVTYSLGYYGGMGDRGPGVYQVPYGEIRVNAQGFPDAEFDLASTKPRIGYVGDSVNFGTGAGYGNRVSEFVEAAYPQFEHWNVGAGVGTGIQHQIMLSKAKDLQLDTMIYLLNMNDIGQVGHSGESRDRTWVEVIKAIVSESLDYFRDKSYLYNWVRLTIKNALYRAGYDYAGRRAVELWPSEHAKEIETMCEFLNVAKSELQAMGSDLCVIVAPYEMQISRQAAQTYRDLGFDWEEGFEDGTTQSRLEACIAFESFYNPLSLFDPEVAEVGEFFVYNRADAIDWNHPTAAGHRKIADGFMASGSCPILSRAEANEGLDLAHQ